MIVSVTETRGILSGKFGNLALLPCRSSKGCNSGRVAPLGPMTKLRTEIGVLKGTAIERATRARYGNHRRELVGGKPID